MSQELGWSDLELVLAIADAMSLSGAAGQLGVNQSTVTRRLEQLEARVGERLFLRTSRGVRATGLTRELLPLARQGQVAVRAVNNAVSRYGDVPAGLVRVATLEAIADHLLVPALPQLWAVAPQLEVELLPSSDTARLLELEADIGLRLVRPREGDLLATRISDLTLTAFASPGYLTHKGIDPEHPTPPEALDWLNWSRARATRLGDGRWVDAVAGAQVRLRSSSMRTLLVAAMQGTGVLLLPDLFGQRLPGLEPVALTGLPPMRTTLYLVRPSSLRDDLAVRCVADWIQGLFT